MTKQTQKPKTEQADIKPVHVIRLRGVKIAVFENKTEQGDFHKVSLQRIYRQGEEWKTTTSLGRDDLPVAKLLLERAWTWILETEAARNRGVSETKED